VLVQRYNCSTRRVDGRSTRRVDGRSTRRVDGRSTRRVDGRSTRRVDGREAVHHWVFERRRGRQWLPRGADVHR
jgi:hypothetical protein